MLGGMPDVPVLDADWNPVTEPKALPGSVVDGDGAFDLRTWALIHGTEALKYRVAHEKDWQRLAAHQWARKQVEPAIFQPFRPERLKFSDKRDLRDFTIRRNHKPTDAEAEVLQRVTEFFAAYHAHLGATFSLVTVKGPDHDPQTELQVVVEVPGEEHRRLLYYSVHTED